MTQAAPPLNLYSDTPSLYREIHSRPFPRVGVPSSVFHFVTLSEKTSAPQVLESLSVFGGDAAPRFSPRAKREAHPVEEKQRSLYLQMEGFDFRWERHREFCSYTFICEEGLDDVLTSACPVTERWLDRLEHPILLACSVKLLPEKYRMGRERMKRYFEDKIIVGGTVMNDKASVWTTFDLHSDNFARYVLFIGGLNEFQTGMLLQKITEIETYRMLALLAFPVAQEISPALNRTNLDLARILEQLKQASTYGEEKEIIHDITEIAAKIEKIRSQTNFRFGASEAYYRIVNARLANLQEKSTPGTSTMSKFLERRLDPAMQTCQAVRSELEQLAQRISRINNILATRVDISLKVHHRELLASMDRRAQIQMRTQQAVQGLSLVAITYYLVAMVGLVVAGVNASELMPEGFTLNPDLAAAFTIAPAAIVAWLIIKQIKKLAGKRGRR